MQPLQKKPFILIRPFVSAANAFRKWREGPTVADTNEDPLPIADKPAPRTSASSTLRRERTEEPERPSIIVDPLLSGGTTTEPTLDRAVLLEVEQRRAQLDASGQAAAAQVGTDRGVENPGGQTIISGSPSGPHDTIFAGLGDGARVARTTGTHVLNIVMEVRRILQDKSADGTLCQVRIGIVKGEDHAAGDTAIRSLLARAEQSEQEWNEHANTLATSVFEAFIRALKKGVVLDAFILVDSFVEGIYRVSNEEETRFALDLRVFALTNDLFAMRAVMFRDIGHFLMNQQNFHQLRLNQVEDLLVSLERRPDSGHAIKTISLVSGIMEDLGLYTARGKFMVATSVPDLDPDKIRTAAQEALDELKLRDPIRGRYVR